MKPFAILLLALGLVSCAQTNKALSVKQYQLRDQIRDRGQDPMVRMEKERRLHGAVSMEERRQRLGQYYTINWNDSKGVNQGPVEVEFEYRQGASGGEIKRMSQIFPPSDTSGVVEFAVIGDNYFDNGKVLAWQATLSRDGRQIAVQKSYLWE